MGFVVDEVALGQVFPPSTSVSLANHHSIKFSILKITLGRYNRPIRDSHAEWTQLESTPINRIKKKKLRESL
jgi:hypothetical protein